MTSVRRRETSPLVESELLLQKNLHVLKVKGHRKGLKEIVANHASEMEAKCIFPWKRPVIEVRDIVFLYSSKGKATHGVRHNSQFSACSRPFGSFVFLQFNPCLLDYGLCQLLLELIARSLGKEPLLVPVPIGLWRMFALVAEMFPQPPITRNQIELMQMDNVVSPNTPGFADLQISPRSLEDVLPAMVGLLEGPSSMPPVA